MLPKENRHSGKNSGDSRQDRSVSWTPEGVPSIASHSLRKYNTVRAPAGILHLPINMNHNQQGRLPGEDTSG